ncbi:hypothetical protein ABK040_007283 [Willaertia magna]
MLDFLTSFYQSFYSWIENNENLIGNDPNYKNIQQLLLVGGATTLLLISGWLYARHQTIHLTSHISSKPKSEKELTIESVDPKYLPEKPLEAKSNLNMKKFWYPICFSKDVTTKDKKAFTFKLLGEPFILFRTKDGKIQCLEDRCPHRSAKLSTGVINDFEGKRSVECAYHGWRFAEEGKCVRIPSIESTRQEGMCKNICVSTRAVHEEFDLIWVWPEKLENNNKADTSLIPRELFREEYLSNKPYVFIEGTRDINCNFSYMVDNLMDFAHVDFTHDGTIGKRSNATAFKTTLLETEEQRKHFPKEMIFDQKVHKDAFSYLVQRPEYKTVNLAKEFGNITSFVPPCFVRLDNTDFTDPTAKKDILFTQVFALIPTDEKHCKVVFKFYSNIPVVNYVKKLPFMDSYLLKFAYKTIEQDFELLDGIEDNVNNNGAKPLCKIVSADAPIKKFRDWEKKMKEYNGDKLWFKGWQVKDIEDLM